MAVRKNFLVWTSLLGVLIFSWACGGKATEPTEENGQNPVTATENKPAQPEPSEPAPEPVEALPADETGAMIQAFAEVLGEQQVSAFEEALSADVENPHANLATLAIYSQHLELAGWLYGKGMLANPEDATLANNFGVCAHEKYLMDLPKDAGGWLQAEDGTSAKSPLALLAARSAFESAINLAPEDSIGFNNLGYLFFEMWKATGAESLLEGAEEHLKKALELNPDNATTLAHLSEVLTAMGKHEEAAQALAKARDLKQLNGVVLTAQARMPEPTRQYYQQQARECNVNFECDKNCTKSIIGRLMFVTCEMEQSSAQMSCQDGQPYPVSYDCREEIPEWGILIPGLNSGFSIVTPFGRVDMIMQGNGEVDFRVKPTVGVGGGRWSGYVEGRGTWSPESGMTRFDTKVGFSYNLVGGTPASDALNNYNLGPASVSAEVDMATGEGTVKGEVYGNTALEH